MKTESLDELVENWEKFKTWVTSAENWETNNSWAKSADYWEINNSWTKAAENWDRKAEKIKADNWESAEHWDIAQFTRPRSFACNTPKQKKSSLLESDCSKKVQVQ